MRIKDYDAARAFLFETRILMHNSEAFRALVDQPRPWRGQMAAEIAGRYMAGVDYPFSGFIWTPSRIVDDNPTIFQTLHGYGTIDRPDGKELG